MGCAWAADLTMWATESMAENLVPCSGSETLQCVISKTEKCIPNRSTWTGILRCRQVTEQMAWDTFCPTSVAQAPGNYLLSPLTPMALALSNLSWTVKLPWTKWRWFAMDWEYIFCHHGWVRAQIKIKLSCRNFCNFDVLELVEWNS